MIAMLVLLGVATTPLTSGTAQLTQCYAERTMELKSSHDPVPIVADAIATLCSGYEYAAKIELTEEFVQHVQMATGGTSAEARRAAESVSEVGWRDWKSVMYQNISASLVQYRSLHPSR